MDNFSRGWGELSVSRQRSSIHFVITSIRILNVTFRVTDGLKTETSGPSIRPRVTHGHTWHRQVAVREGE